MSSTPQVAVSYREQIQATQHDPEAMERLYQAARRAHHADQFAQEVHALYQESADNVLYAVWHYRLQQSAGEDWFTRIGSHWRLAIAMSVLLGLVLWGLSDPGLALDQQTPVLDFVAAPLTALFLASFFFLVTRAQAKRLALTLAALAACTVYVLLVLPRLSANNEYLPLAALHLALLAGGALVIFLAGWRLPTREVFAFLLKALETVGTAGVYVIIGGIFVGLTYLLFDAIGVELNNLLLRLLVFGGAGLIPLIAVLSVYDPKISLSAQEFRRGFARIVLIGIHALLPLTLLILVLFLVVLPFNFFQAYDNRATLIVFNALLFAVLGLLVGLIPLNAEEFSPTYQRWLYRGVVLLVGLVLLVSLYALSAIISRAAQDQLTMNQLTVIGWNTINIALLGLLLYRLLRPGSRFWGDAAQTVFRPGAYAYLAWGSFLLLALPWLL